MTTGIRERAIETIHDQVVNQIAQRWATAFHCRVTTKTGLERYPWADGDQQCDIVGWYVSSGWNSMEWMAEVETAESLADDDTKARWRKTVVRGVPTYLLVPRGQKERAQSMAQEAAVAFTCIYEYSLLDDVCHIV
jgi:hypothetical protein